MCSRGITATAQDSICNCDSPDLHCRQHNVAKAYPMLILHAYSHCPHKRTESQPPPCSLVRGHSDQHHLAVEEGRLNAIRLMRKPVTAEIRSVAARLELRLGDSLDIQTAVLLNASKNGQRYRAGSIRHELTVCPHGSSRA